MAFMAGLPFMRAMVFAWDGFGANGRGGAGMPHHYSQEGSSYHYR